MEDRKHIVLFYIMLIPIGVSLAFATIVLIVQGVKQCLSFTPLNITAVTFEDVLPFAVLMGTDIVILKVILEDYDLIYKIRKYHAKKKKN